MREVRQRPEEGRPAGCGLGAEEGFPVGCEGWPAGWVGAEAGWLDCGRPGWGTVVQ